MHAQANPQLSRSERRRGMRLGVLQGTLYALGNGLTTGAFLQYFAIELQATGFELGLILALPGLFGILRLVAPALFRLSGDYKWPCILTLGGSYSLVIVLPMIPFADWQPLANPLHFFIAVLCVHQLLEYIALVGIWAWLGQIVPGRIRGRYFGVRQRWQLAVQIPSTILAGFLVDLWRGGALLGGVTLTHRQVVWGYVAALEVGAVFLMASIVPLVAMPDVDVSPSLRIRTRLRWPEVAPFARLLLAGCWISFFAGLTTTAQSIYPFVVGIGVWGFTSMKGVMQLGQLALAPVVGRLSDRYGNRPVLAASQAVVALGPLFYFISSPGEPWWIVFAWLAFSAYVGLNVCLPNLMLKLSPQTESSHYVALYFGLTGVAAAIGASLGGWLLDYFRFSYFRVGPFTVDEYDYVFWIGFVTRMLGVVFLATLVEPGAWRVRDALRDWIWGSRSHTQAARDQAGDHPARG